MGKIRVGKWSGNTYDAWLSVYKAFWTGYHLFDIKRSNKHFPKTSNLNLGGYSMQTATTKKCERTMITYYVFGERVVMT